jgi:hypothetical protein
MFSDADWHRGSTLCSTGVHHTQLHQPLRISVCVLSPLRLQDMLRRPVGPPRKFVNPISDPEGAFGYSHWGFTKANELFAGRIAMLVRTHIRCAWQECDVHGMLKRCTPVCEKLR